MDRYFRYQLAELPKRPLRDWGKFRWQDEVLSVIWLYNRTGSPYLLDLAHLLQQQGYDWMAQYANFQYTQKITAEYIKLNEGGGLKDLALATHGVNNGQAVKTGPVWSLVSGADADRKAAAQMIAELDKYHGLPNGMFSCDEHLAGRDPSQGSELCTVVEYMFSLERSLAITGDPALGDRLETARLQRASRHPHRRHVGPPVQPGAQPGGVQPAPQAVGQRRTGVEPLWPGAELRLLHRQLPPGLAQVRCEPCSCSPANASTNQTRRSCRRRLRALRSAHHSRAEFPFTSSKKPTIRSAAKYDSPSIQPPPLQFPLQLRIPAWAAGTTHHGQRPRRARTRRPVHSRAIERTWKAGDRVEITFPMKPRISRWFNDSDRDRTRAARLLLRHRRKLGKAARSRHDRRLAGLSDHAMELRVRHRYSAATRASK